MFVDLNVKILNLYKQHCDYRNMHNMNFLTESITFVLFGVACLYY